MQTTTHSEQPSDLPSAAAVYALVSVVCVALGVSLLVAAACTRQEGYLFGLGMAALVVGFAAFPLWIVATGAASNPATKREP